MGYLKPHPPNKGKVIHPKSGKNEVWVFHATKSGIKKYVPVRR